VIIGPIEDVDLALAYFVGKGIFKSLLTYESSVYSWFFNYKNHNFLGEIK
jgi:hypothetical protein